ncbi:MAG: hypothetical protein HY553_21445 [Elusimicrobia bacterium]|nr:hypothetical protein [Elusimicrobiota bacterium]
MSSRSIVVALALLAAGSTGTWAQTAVDPLTGATPDAGAALGSQPYEAVYFDSKGNVTDDASQAVKYSITDNVQGMSTIPKPMSDMSPQDRQKLGLATPPSETARTAPPKPEEKPEGPAETPKDKVEGPAEKPADRPAETAADEPAREDPDSQIVAGTQEKDPATGIVYGDVKPQLVEAARQSYASPGQDGGAAAGPRSSSFSTDAPAQAYVAPAVASQVSVLEPGGREPRGYRALASLVSLQKSLVDRLQSFLGPGAESRLAGYAGVYDNTTRQASPDLQTRASDDRFGVAQRTTEQ